MYLGGEVRGVRGYDGKTESGILETELKRKGYSVSEKEVTDLAFSFAAVQR